MSAASSRPLKSLILAAGLIGASGFPLRAGAASPDALKSGAAKAFGEKLGAGPSAGAPGDAPPSLSLKLRNPRLTAIRRLRAPAVPSPSVAKPRRGETPRILRFARRHVLGTTTFLGLIEALTNGMLMGAMLFGPGALGVGLIVGLLSGAFGGLMAGLTYKILGMLPNSKTPDGKTSLSRALLWLRKHPVLTSSLAGTITALFGGVLSTALLLNGVNWASSFGLGMVGGVLGGIGTGISYKFLGLLPDS